MACQWPVFETRWLQTLHVKRQTMPLLLGSSFAHNSRINICNCGGDQVHSRIPVQSALKFSAVLGTRSAKSCTIQKKHGYLNSNSINKLCQQSKDTKQLKTKNNSGKEKKKKQEVYPWINYLNNNLFDRTPFNGYI